jgi:hypothetical protein
VVQHQRRARAATRRATRCERLGPRCCHGMAPSRAPWPPCWASCAGCRVRWLPRAASKPPRTRAETPDLATLAARWLAGAQGRTCGPHCRARDRPRAGATLGREHGGRGSWLGRIAGRRALATGHRAGLLVAAAAGCRRCWLPRRAGNGCLGLKKSWTCVKRNSLAARKQE